MEKRLVALYDLHIPYTIDLEPIYKFLKDFKPNVVIIGGDFLDLPYLSCWSQRRLEYFMEDKPRAEYDNDIKEANNILDIIDDCCEEGAEKEYLEGNHEFRLHQLTNQFYDKKRTILDIYDYKKDLMLSERNYDWHSYNQVIKKGCLFYTHGVYHTVNHSRKHLQVYSRNIRYGHLHTYRS